MIMRVRRCVSISNVGSTNSPGAAYNNSFKNKINE